MRHISIRVMTKRLMPKQLLPRRLVIVGAAALMSVACQTSTETEAAAKPDAREGKEVSQICFSQQIRNWKANDRNSIIVEKNRDQEYKLELAGSCNPQDAFTTIGLVSRVSGGTCLSSGDKLVTDSRFDTGPCSIVRINEWLPEPPAKPADAS